VNHPWLKPLSLFTVLTCLSVSAQAQNQQTDIRPQAQRVLGEEIRAEFEGVTHSGAYNFTFQGIAQNTYVETHFPDGRVIYKEGDFEADGRWFINQDNLCFVYPDEAMNGGCFRVYKVENCFYYYSNQIREVEGELDQDYWTARSVIEGEAPQCEAAIS
jgi:hypothetical protein